MSKHGKRSRETDKHDWVETRPWQREVDCEEIWSYEMAMRRLKARGYWSDIPDGMHFAEFCDELVDWEDWYNRYTTIGWTF